MQTHRSLVLATLLVVACAPGGRSSSAPQPATRTSIGVDELRADLFAFAADSFRGRESGTPDGARAARWLAARLQALGVEPAGDSGYFQRVPLTRTAITSQSRLAVTADGRSTPLTIGVDLMPVPTLGPGVPPSKLSADGQIVFVGYGLSDPALNRDDFADVDVEGKIAVVINGAPAGADSAKRVELESEQQVGQRLGQLIARRPAAVIILLAGASAAAFDDVRGHFMTMVTAQDTTTVAGDEARPLPMILLGPLPAAGSPLLPAGYPADDRPQVLTGRRFTGRVEVRKEQIAAYNVLGIVRGSDPAFAQTYVAYGAHYDHIGIQPAVKGDSIANGADDDASGSVALLAVARRWVQAPARPKRSALFVWHTAEERGLLGSAHFVQHPTVPVDSIVAQLNADMIGRNSPDSIFIVGPQSAPRGQSVVLGQIIDSVNTASPRPFSFDRTYDAPGHPERIYYRSDHYSYARKGVPVLFLTTGLHEDYHKVSDEPGKIAYAKLARVAELLHGTGVAIGNRATRPK